jgi:hypothetical protein
MEFTALNSPKGFWRSLPEISLLFSQSLSSKDLFTNSSTPFPFAFARLNALQAAARHSLSLSDTSSLLIYTSKSKANCIKKKSTAIESKGLNCNNSSFQVLGAIGDLFLSKLCKCIC